MPDAVWRPPARSPQEKGLLLRSHHLWHRRHRAADPVLLPPGLAALRPRQLQAGKFWPRGSRPASPGRALPRPLIRSSRWAGWQLTLLFGYCPRPAPAPRPCPPQKRQVPVYGPPGTAVAMPVEQVAVPINQPAPEAPVSREGWPTTWGRAGGRGCRGPGGRALERCSGTGCGGGTRGGRVCMACKVGRRVWAGHGGRVCRRHVGSGREAPRNTWGRQSSPNDALAQNTAYPSIPGAGEAAKLA